MAEATARKAEPERELVRRALPFGPPCLLVALGAGGLAGGWATGWSATLGVAVVFANLAASAAMLVWAGRISLQALYAAALGGFVIRLAVITGLLVLLNRFAFFSPLAFLLAVVPATILLLAYEMKLLSGGLGSELVIEVPREGRNA